MFENKFYGKVYKDKNVKGNTNKKSIYRRFILEKTLKIIN